VRETLALGTLFLEFVLGFSLCCGQCPQIHPLSRFPFFFSGCSCCCVLGVLIGVYFSDFGRGWLGAAAIPAEFALGFSLLWAMPPKSIQLFCLPFFFLSASCCCCVLGVFIEFILPISEEGVGAMGGGGGSCCPQHQEFHRIEL
jgi:hypothetical protein